MFSTNKTQKKVLIAMVLSSGDLGVTSAGGVDSVCQDLLLGMIANRSDGHEYLVIGFSPVYNPALSGEEEVLSKNIRLRQYNYYYNRKSFFYKILPNFIYHNFIIKREVERFGPDVLHVHLYSWLLFRYQGIKKILTLHSYKKIARASVNILNDYLHTNFLTKVAIHRADVITTVSKEVEMLIKQSGKGVSYIDNPICESFFSVQRAEHLLEAKPLLVMTGVVEPRKRVLDALKILQLLKKKEAAVKLIIAGKKNEKSEYFNTLMRYIRANDLSNNVEFLGSVPRAKLRELYASARIGLFLSESETFGLAALEMMATGLPTIVTNIGVIQGREDIFLKSEIDPVEPGDVKKSISQCFNILKKNMVRNEKASMIIKDNFSTDAVLSSYAKIYGT